MEQALAAARLVGLQAQQRRDKGHSDGALLLQAVCQEASAPPQNCPALLAGLSNNHSQPAPPTCTLWQRAAFSWKASR